MSESVHVLRVPSLPDNQEVAVACRHDGSAIIYMLEEHITPEGALALERALSAARVGYERQWSRLLAAVV